MKVEKEIQIPAKVIRTPAGVKKVTRISCDICGKPVDPSQDNHYGSGGHNCQLCGRDVCRNRKAPYTPTCFKHGGDEWDTPPYDKYCIYCYDLLFVKYKSRFEDIEASRDLLIKKLEKAIKKESLSKETKV